MCRWRHKIRKIAVKILQCVNNRTQCLRESAYYAWLLLTYTVINTILGRLTLDPAGMHCRSWDDAFVSSVVYGGSMQTAEEHEQVRMRDLDSTHHETLLKLMEALTAFVRPARVRLFVCSMHRT